MTRDDPGLDAGAITSCILDHYGIHVKCLRYLPIGHDFSAFVYEAIAVDGAAYFLKVRSGSINEAALEVPRALIDQGIDNILAPMTTRAGDLRCELDAGHTIVLYPFIHGQNAMVTGLTPEQVREFGATLRAVHDSGLAERFRDVLRVEDFTIPSAALVRDILAMTEDSTFGSPAATRLATFLQDNAPRIHDLLDREEEIGRSLQSRTRESVLCHSDIHTANILVGDDGRIWLIDWDGPLIAPRERDLFFVIGSKIARPLNPREGAIFFEGYGPVEIDPDALIYARYERIIEDIGEDAKSVFLDPRLGEEMRENEADLAMSFFTPGGDIDRAETVILPW
jgi:spectinomycin phosphotransferase